MHTVRTRTGGFVVALVLAAAAALAPSGAAQASMMGGDGLHARMHPTAAYPSAHGGAWYESHRGWREFNLHLWGIKKLAGKRVTVTVHGAYVGRMRVSSYGTGHLYRHHGMPRCGRGDRIQVRTASGTLVSYGTLRRHHHMMW